MPLGFHFWHAYTGSNDRLDVEDARCFVGGVRVAGNFDFSLGNSGQKIESPIKTGKGDSFTTMVQMTLRFKHVGRVAFSSPDRARLFAGDVADWVQLNKNPGDWKCEYRSGGEVAREFRFRVAADGTLLPHGEQSPGTAALNLDPGQVMVGIRFPSGGKFDAANVYSADAMRRHSFFGRPWTAVPSF